MNKRIKKKKQKQLEKWVAANYDTYDAKSGNYRTIPMRCYSCMWYEPGDSSVGLPEGCNSPALFDKNDDIIESVDIKIIKHQSNLGYGCNYYRGR